MLWGIPPPLSDTLQEKKNCPPWIMESLESMFTQFLWISNFCAKLKIHENLFSLIEIISHNYAIFLFISTCHNLLSMYDTNIHLSKWHTWKGHMYGIHACPINVQIWPWPLWANDLNIFKFLSINWSNKNHDWYIILK